MNRKWSGYSLAIYILIALLLFSGCAYLDKSRGGGSGQGVGGNYTAPSATNLPSDNLSSVKITDESPGSGSNELNNYVGTNFTKSSNQVPNRGSADRTATDGDNTHVSNYSLRYIYDGTVCGQGCGVADGNGLETLTLNSNGTYILTSEPSGGPADISDWKNGTKISNGVTLHFKSGELTISGNYSVNNNTVTISNGTQFMTEFMVSGNNLIRGGNNGSGDVFVEQ